MVLADLPVGLAAWIYDKFAEWVFTRDEPERSLTRDEMLNGITLYWLTHTGTSSARLYWENNADNVGAYHQVDKGGHFAAWEEPQLFSEEICAAFRLLR
ncbi:MAG: hypothetical protein Kow00121_28590 [Elainellaceae cyanobacterium]